MNIIIEMFLNKWQDYFLSLIIIISSIIAGIIVYLIVIIIFKMVTRKTKTIIDDLIIKHLKAPFKIFLPLIIIFFSLPLIKIDPKILNIIQNVFSTFLILNFSWLLIKTASIFEDIIKDKFRKDSKNNLIERKIQTQILFIKKILIIIILIISLSMILMKFKGIKHLGATLLTSAGVAGLIIGFSAQKTLSTLLAGFQIAFTQPIRIDDVVIVENEWGWIEEITLTYVVVRIWDLRRLILPINYFIEKPFQNWTRSSANIMGTIFIYTDYTISIDEIRNKLEDFCKESQYWDNKTCTLQVTDSKENTLELRALVSADDSSKCWDLRCEIREKLIKYIQQNHPDKLPKIRVNLNNK